MTGRTPLLLPPSPLPEGVAARPLETEDAAAFTELVRASEAALVGEPLYELDDAHADWRQPSLDLATRSIALHGGRGPRRRGRAVHAVIDGSFSEWAGRRPQTYDDWHAEMIDRPDAAPWQVRALRDAAGDVVGAATVMGSAGGAAFVHELAVRRDLRGRGLGTALLAAAVTAGRERGCARCQLSTDSRSGAVALYERLGFAVTSTWRRLALDIAPRDGDGPPPPSSCRGRRAVGGAPISSSASCRARRGSWCPWWCRGRRACGRG